MIVIQDDGFGLSLLEYKRLLKKIFLQFLRGHVPGKIR